LSWIKDLEIRWITSVSAIDLLIEIVNDIRGRLRSIQESHV